MKTEVVREPPKKDEVWIHYRGGKYEIKEIAFDADSSLPYVVYRSLQDGRIWVRVLFRFMSEVRNAEHPDAVWRYTREEDGQDLSRG